MRESQPVVEIVPRTRHNQLNRECDDTVIPKTEREIPKSTVKNENLTLINPVQTTISKFNIKTDE